MSWHLGLKFDGGCIVDGKGQEKHVTFCHCWIIPLNQWDSLRNHQQMSREQVITCHNGQPRLYISVHIPITSSTLNLVPTHISSILFLTIGYFINLLRLHLRQLYSVCFFSFYFAKCKIYFFSEYRNTLWKWLGTVMNS